MSLTLKATEGGGSYALAPEGVYAARCYSIIDRGMVEVKGMYPGMKHKIMISWELDTLMDDGQPYSVSESLTASLHENARMRERLTSWRGKSFTEEELKEFELKKVLGAPCMLNIVHGQSGEKTYANIASISPLPKSMSVPPAHNPQVYWEYGDDLADLPARQHSLIGSNPNPTEEEAVDDLAGFDQSADDFDDDIPF